ncbi:MAG: hypothetical protein ACREA4_12290, partial [Nitrososphaera sp.]
MIELNNIKKSERTAAISASIKENNRDAGGKKEHQGKKSFSLFGKKSSMEELKKKVGPNVTPPISADPKAVEDFRVHAIERYAVKEPVLYVTIARDDIGSLVYLIEEPVLTEEETMVYSRLMDVLQYELKAPYDGIDPKKYFDEQAKKIITKYAMSMGITPNVTWNKIYYYITRDMVGFG